MGGDGRTPGVKHTFAAIPAGTAFTFDIEPHRGEIDKGKLICHLFTRAGSNGGGSGGTIDGIRQTGGCGGGII
jgi:hypothetical protein